MFVYFERARVDRACLPCRYPRLGPLGKTNKGGVDKRGVENFREHEKCTVSKQALQSDLDTATSKHKWGSVLDSLRGSSVMIGTMQQILAWPLRKDDTRNSRSVTNIYIYIYIYIYQYKCVYILYIYTYIGICIHTYI